MRYRALLALAVAPLLSACGEQEMADMPRYEPLEPAETFADGMSARRPVAGTVARDADLAPVPDSVPQPVTRALLERGRQRFEIYCAPCHSRTGDGDGMIVRRGFPAPPSFHSETLRRVSDRHIYDVITDGYGVMYSYAARVTPADRWAIVAYVRALQLSRHAPAAALPDDLKAGLEAAGTENRP